MEWNEFLHPRLEHDDDDDRGVISHSEHLRQEMRGETWTSVAAVARDFSLELHLLFSHTSTLFILALTRRRRRRTGAPALGGLAPGHLLLLSR